MRSTRLTALVLAFGVGAAGAYGADAALAQDGNAPAPQRPREDDETARALRELGRLLDDLLAPTVKRPTPAEPRRAAPRGPDPFEELWRELQRELTPEERARRTKAMQDAQRDFERRMADMDRRFVELRRKMDADLKRMFGGQSPFGPGGLFGELRGQGGQPRRPFGQGRVQPGKGNSSRSFKLGPNGVSEVTITEGDETIRGTRDASGIVIEVRKPGADGKVAKSTYRAKDAAEFKTKYPEQADLFDRTFGRGRGLFVEFGPFRQGPKGPAVTPPVKLRSVPPNTTGTLSSAKLGFTADHLSGLLATQLRIPAGQGLYVKSIASDGWAEGAGLEPRDVILFVGGAPVTSVADLEQVISGTTGGDETITLVLQRQGVRLELGVPK